jgi:aldehyde:ferredoxin oxidoreductase
MDFKRAGCDAMIVEGKADSPVYIWIDPLGEAEIRDAAALWGKTVQETEATIREEVGESRARVAAIGPAGENLVRYACVICDLKDAYGRGGIGAVMGSKNLKAIAVRGKQMPEVVDSDKITQMGKWFSQNLRDIPIFNQGFSDHGTICLPTTLMEDSSPTLTRSAP